MNTKFLFTAVLILCLNNQSYSQNSNYIYENGTLWHTGFYDILKSSDESVLDNTSYKSEEKALMWDRLANNGNGAWVEPLSWIFTINYKDNISAEIRIRQSDYTKTEADQAVERYKDYLGRLPYVLRNGIKLINIMKGNANFGGNNWNNSIDIYEGDLSERIIKDGNVEEMLLHEGAHSALDYLYNEDWITERNKDTKFVSKYAFDNPNREDISETFAVWLALRNVDNRLSTEDYNKVTQGLSNRINYLNSLNFDINPIVGKALSTENFKYEENILFPNPVKNQINLINIDAKAYVIYNFLGVKVLEGIIKNNRVIPFDSFNTGLYFIKLDNNKQIKFIKE